MKKYQKVLAISLLVLSIHQFSRADQSFEQIFQAAEPQAALENSEFPKHSTDQYVYAVTVKKEQTEQVPLEVVSPIVISDTIHNHYFNSGKTRTLVSKQIQDAQKIITIETWTTKNPSYLTWKNGAIIVGVAGVAFLTYMAIKFWRLRKELDALPILPKPSSVQDVEKDLQGVNFNKDVNFPLLFAVTKDYSQDEYNRFIKNVKMQSLLTKVSIGHQGALHANDKFAVAYHEAGHALMLALTSEVSIVNHISIIPGKGYGGYMKDDRLMAGLLKLTNKDLRLQELKNQMMMLMSGGIGYQLLHGQRLQADQFLKSEYTRSLGMGSLEDQHGGLDMFQFKKLAAFYAEYNKKDIKAIAVECYEDAYDILDAHKDRLDALAQKLYKEEFLGQDETYKIIDIERPQYLYERIIPQAILNFGKKLVDDTPRFVDTLQTGDVDAENYALSGYSNRDALGAAWLLS